MQQIIIIIKESMLFYKKKITDVYNIYIELLL